MTVTTKTLRQVLIDDFGITTVEGNTAITIAGEITNAAIAANTAKTGITAQQAADIEANKIPAMVVKASTDTLSATECSNTVISNYEQAAANVQTLPDAADKLSGLVIIATAGAGNFSLKAGASDKIHLDGVALDDGDKATLDTPALGDFFSFVSFKNGTGGFDWIVRTGQGTLIDGGA